MYKYIKRERERERERERGRERKKERKKERERERKKKLYIYIYIFKKNGVYFYCRIFNESIGKFQVWSIPLVEACQGWGGFQVWKNCEMIELAIGFRSVRAPVASISMSFWHLL